MSEPAPEPMTATLRPGEPLPSPAVAICQPHYLPWIGYFEMIDRVDHFVFFDDVQFVRREWKNRNRIRKDLRSEDTKWLTVPVVRDPWPGKPINATEVRADEAFFTAHRQQIEAVYRKAPQMPWLLPLLDELEEIAATAEDLATLNIETTRRICRKLGIATRLSRASEFAADGQKTDRLLALLEATGARAYLANDASRVYLDVAQLAEAGIRTAFQSYTHPAYAQRYGEGGPALPLPPEHHRSPGEPRPAEPGDPAGGAQRRLNPASAHRTCPTRLRPRLRRAPPAR